MITTRAWFAIGALVLIVAMSMFGGCSMQKRQDSAKLERAAADLRTSAGALGDARAALKAASAATRKAETDAKVQKARADEAAEVVSKALAMIPADNAKFAASIKKGARSEQCRQLLAVDVEAVCGVSLR